MGGWVDVCEGVRATAGKHERVSPAYLAAQWIEHIHEEINRCQWPASKRCGFWVKAHPYPWVPTPPSPTTHHLSQGSRRGDNSTPLPRPHHYRRPPPPTTSNSGRVNRPSGSSTSYTVTGSCGRTASAGSGPNSDPTETAGLETCVKPESRNVNQG